MNTADPLTSLHADRERCARQLLALHQRAHAGHIGPCLSCLEILVELCFSRMKPDDRLILSKGHAAAALYTTLSLSGRLPGIALETFYQDNTLLAAHPPCASGVEAIPFGTGSLGHGLSLAAGLAFSQRFTGRSFHVYAVLSDGDCNEGSTWEAALFAAHHRLENLTVIVDRNGIQGFGYSKDVLGLEPFAEKWRSFGFAVAIAERGNDFSSLRGAHEEAASSEGPRCVVARTIKGHGVSFMENRVEWHYKPMDDAQYAQAVSECSAANPQPPSCA
jgi:transketolase